MPSDENNGRDGDSDGNDPVGIIPLQSTVSTRHFTRTACPRGGVSVQYGQDMYLSDVSDDEIGTSLLSKSCRTSHIRASTFADNVMVIHYDVNEDVLISTKWDVISNKTVAPCMAVSEHTKNDSSQQNILGRNIAQNRTMSWANSQYDSILDTKQPQESSLGFPRVVVWNIARAIARARAVYARFLFMITELLSMADCDVP